MSLARSVSRRHTLLRLPRLPADPQAYHALAPQQRALLALQGEAPSWLWCLLLTDRDTWVRLLAWQTITRKTRLSR